MRKYELLKTIDSHITKQHLLQLLLILSEKFPGELAFSSYENLQGSTKWEKLHSIFTVLETYQCIYFLTESIRRVKPDDKELIQNLNIFANEHFHYSKTNQSTLQGMIKENEDPNGGRLKMDWNRTIALAVSAVSPYAVELAKDVAVSASSGFGEAAFKSIKEIWQWIQETVDGSNDKSTKETWEKFKHNPKSNKEDLSNVIQEIASKDDDMLKKYVNGLLHQFEVQNDTNLFSLLDSQYTFAELKRICSRINIRWEDDLGSNPARERLGRWVVEYAGIKNRRQDLIAIMLEFNPNILLK